MVKFSELSKESQDKIVGVYYSGGKVKALLEELGVEENYRQIYKCFEPETLNEKCEYCDVNLLRKRLARNKDSIESIYCPVCKHKPQVQNCECPKCQDKRMEEKYRPAINDYWNKKREKVKYSSMGFREKVYLGAVLRVGSDRTMKVILPLDKVHIIVSPRYGSYLYEMANDLYNSKVLVPRSDAPLNAFVLNDKEFPKHFYPVCMKFDLNVDTNSESELYSLLTFPQYYTTEDASDALKIWIKIATYECLEYLIYQLNLFGYEFDEEKKALAIFDALLNYYSVSQIYSIIWASVSTEVRDIQLYGLDKEEAGNQVLILCQEFTNYLPEDRKMVGQFNKIDDLPQSEISEFFFNQVVQIGDKGFYHVPNLEDLKCK